MSVVKENAALAALDFVEDGMVLGLGSGSTAEIFIDALGERIAGGLKVSGVPTSKRTAECAIEAGVPLVEPDKVDRINLTVDGADEVDPAFNLIKGGGACLLREKIIAQASDRMIVIVDSLKMVEMLGRFPLPIEVEPFGMALTAEQVFDALKSTGCEEAQTVLRQMKDGSGPLVTDGGNYILDSRCRKIPNPADTALALSQIPGVMEHGLFIDLADVVIVGEADHARVIELSRD
ncbi:ribose-5-phosphate isomerase A [Litorimonas cladophorae]|jgi:ribose 5-phosphate isomerase A|uniref:Ribose-5-phosphate isomerase A n=1 Tax=Litorimonas cladophorae TaxID=1220491 RepID=A0A918NDY0_9PROT|nr:ribose-5-phosphate isomerase RpiA [Litorimonas cladophorae]GGX60189.1 ribose-5-phosphate isomerase A [Litorimonas cladophorae]